MMDKQNVCPHNRTLLSLKRKDTPAPATTQKNLEDAMLSEISQAPKDRFCVVGSHYVILPGGVKSTETGSRRLASRVWGWGVLFYGDRVSIWEDERVLEMRVVKVAQQ